MLKARVANRLHLFAKKPDRSQVIQHQSIPDTGKAAGDCSSHRDPFAVYDRRDNVGSSQVHSRVKLAVAFSAAIKLQSRCKRIQELIG